MLIKCRQETVLARGFGSVSFELCWKIYITMLFNVAFFCSAALAVSASNEWRAPTASDRKTIGPITIFCS